MKQETLKNCPFCGENCADIAVDQGNKWAHYEAGCLEVRTGYIMDEDATWRDEAIKAWNTRAESEEIEELRAALEFYANEENWKRIPDNVNSLDMTEFPISATDYDVGKIARAALRRE